MNPANTKTSNTFWSVGPVKKLFLLFIVLFSVLTVSATTEENDFLYNNSIIYLNAEEGSGTLAIEQGKGFRNGTLRGNAHFNDTIVKLGSFSYSFDGAGGTGINLTATTIYTPSNYCAMAWVFTAVDNGATQHVFSVANVGGTNGVRGVMYQAAFDTARHQHLTGAANNADIKNMDANYTAGVWHMVSYSYDNVSRVMQQRKNASDVVKAETGGIGEAVDSLVPYYIGTGQSAGPLSETLHGNIDGFLMLNVSCNRTVNGKTLDEIYYNNGTGLTITAPGIDDTPPDAVLDADWITPATDPDTDNLTPFLFNWTASSDPEGQNVSYEFIVNGSVIARVNNTHYLHTFGGAGSFAYTVNVSEQDDLVEWVAGDVRTFIVDVSPPGATRVSPDPDNTTLFSDASQVIINSTYTDDNEVFAYNMSIWGAEFRNTQLFVERGTLNSGNGTSLYFDDDDVLDVQEQAGSPSTLININFTGASDINKLHMVALHDGNPADIIQFEVFNHTTASWAVLTTLTTNGSVDNQEFFIAEADVLLGGVVQTRFNHVSSGHAGDQLLVSKVSLHSRVGITPLLHTEEINLNVTSISVQNTFNMLGLDVGEYIVRDEVVDSHTAHYIDSVIVTRNDELHRVSFERDVDTIGLQHVSTELLSGDTIIKDVTLQFNTWETTQLFDRVQFTQSSSVVDEGLYKHVYTVSSTHPLYMKHNSVYAGHIVSGLFSWVDFEHDGLVSASMQRSGRDVLVTIISHTPNPEFNSIGGLNRIFLYTAFRIEESAPLIINLNSEDNINYSITRSWLFNATVTDLAGVDTVTLELNETNISMTNIEGDIYQGSAGVLGVGTRQWKVHANESAGVSGASSVFNHTIFQALGIVNLTATETMPVTNGTTFNVSCTTPNAEQTVTLYVNGTLNGTNVTFTELTQSFFIVCNVSSTGNFSFANTSLLVSVTLPDVISGILQPNECPNNTTTEVLMFGLLFFMLITLVVINTLVIKLPFLDAGAGLGMIFIAVATIGCSIAIGGVMILFGVALIIYSFSNPQGLVR